MSQSFLRRLRFSCVFSFEYLEKDFHKFFLVNISWDIISILSVIIIINHHQIYHNRTAGTASVV